MRIIWMCMFAAVLFVGCESSASKSTVRTDTEGKTSSEVVEHKVKTDLPVEEWGTELLKKKEDSTEGGTE